MTPLWFASHNGYLPVVQFILSTGREVDTKTKSVAGDQSWNEKTAAEIGRVQATRAEYQGELEEDYTRRKQNGPLIAALIDTFDADPVTTRQQLRELPEIRDSFISDLFAELIFFCDGLLAVSVEASGTDKAARFFLSCAVSSDRTANGAL